MYVDLRRLLKAYKNGNNKSYKRGDWGISEGGYDLWFEIYYKDIPKIQCVDGELELGNDDEIDGEKVLQIIKDILKYVKIKTI